MVGDVRLFGLVMIARFCLPKSDSRTTEPTSGDRLLNLSGQTKDYEVIVRGPVKTDPCASIVYEKRLQGSDRVCSTRIVGCLSVANSRDRRGSQNEGYRQCSERERR